MKEEFYCKGCVSLMHTIIESPELDNGKTALVNMYYCALISHRVQIEEITFCNQKK